MKSQGWCTSRHPTQDLHGVVRADCCAPVVEDVGWGDILPSPVDLHGYVDSAMLHYYCITLERRMIVIIALYTLLIQNIHYIPLFLFGRACNLDVEILQG